MEGDNPLGEIVWLAGGSEENESMVVYHLRMLQDDMRFHWPKVQHRIYTNCKDITGWQSSYIVGTKDMPTKMGHAFQKGIRVTSAMYYEEGLQADLYISNDISSAWALYGHGLAFWNRPLPPVVIVYPKAPEEYHGQAPPDYQADVFRFLGCLSTFWICVLDNEREVELARKCMLEAGYPDFDRIRKVNTYSWPGEPFPTDKANVVVWSGRMTSQKNPKLGAEVMALLPASISKEVFFPRAANMATKDQAAFYSVPGVVVHAGEPPEIYREMTRQAKVLLVTSVGEGYGVGYIELMGQGCIPVLYRQKWNEDILPADWPLRFRTAGEAAEMVLEAMERYEYYAVILREWMEQRFRKPLNFHEIIQEVWASYTLDLGDKMRLVADRGARRSL